MGNLYNFIQESQFLCRPNTQRSISKVTIYLCVTQSTHESFQINPPLLTVIINLPVSVSSVLAKKGVRARGQFGSRRIVFYHNEMWR